MDTICTCIWLVWLVLTLISMLHFNYSSFGKRVKVELKKQGCPDEFLIFTSIVFPFFPILYWMFMAICYFIVLRHVSVADEKQGDL